MKNIGRNMRNEYVKKKRECDIDKREREKEKNGEKEKEKKKEERAVYWTGRIARKETCEKGGISSTSESVNLDARRRKGSEGYRRRDEMHQACGSGFVRPPLCLSFLALRCACSSYFYRLWQFPRRTLWVRKREKARLSLRVSSHMY